MTTETRTAPPASVARGVGVLGRSALVAAGAGAVVVVLAMVLMGPAAAVAALVGAAITVTVLLSGALVVDLVARTAPHLSLLVALATYATHVGIFALLLIAVTRAGGLEGSVDLPWLAGGVIAAALTWTVAQVVLATRARIPAFDLPSDSLSEPAPSASARRASSPDEPRTRGV